MEYLVDMTTHVPDRTPPQAIDDIRTRESKRAQQLAAQGHLLRLWHPPLQPGQWRSLALFACDDSDDLTRILTTMPPHAWRTDEVTSLTRHPNDPALEVRPETTEFLTTFTVTVPAGTPPQAVEHTNARAAERVHQLAGQGYLARLWTLPGEGRSLGLWQTHDAAEMQAILESLPLGTWVIVQTRPLTRHPNDPATAKT